MDKCGIVYFDAPGGENTDMLLDAVVERLRKGDIRHVVIASDSGKTALKALTVVNWAGVSLVVVTEQCGSDKEGENTMDPGNEKKLLDAGVRIVRATHALSGVERSINKKVGGSSRVEAIAEALRSLFGQGMKVAVEITVMAADNGAIPCGPEAKVIAVGGTEWGSDTAIVVKPAHSNGFFNLQVKEVIAMPAKR
jgi:hypothetical protein